MGDIDDADLLAPTAHPRASRATYPFKRAQSDQSSNLSAEDGSVGALKVVYDRQFDRFFLREASSPNDLSVLVTSPKPRRAGCKPAPAKKRSLASGVQWEDLIVPPRSVIKRNEGDISYDYRGLNEDAANSDIADTLVTRTEQTRVLQAPTEQARSAPQLTPVEQTETSPMLQGLPPVVTIFPVQSKSADAPTQEEVSEGHQVGDVPGPQGPPTIHPHAPSPEDTATESPDREVPTPAIETVDSNDVVGSDQMEPQQPSAPEVSATQPPADVHADPVNQTPSGSSASNAPVSGTARATPERGAEDFGRGSGLSKFASLVRVLQFLRWHVRRRRSDTADPVAPAGGDDPLQAVAAVEVVTPGESVAPSEPLAGGASAVVSTNGADSVASESHSAEAVDHTPVTQGDNTSVPALRLDLSKLTAQQTTSSLLRAKSPRRKSPKRRARAGTYAHRYEDTINTNHSAAPSAFLHVDNQHEHEVRWQGEVIHVNIAVRASNDLVPLAPRGYAVAAQNERRQPISHVYSLHELARIRPHADGFRRVNEACTFTALTSSSESSESEAEQAIAVVQVPSSSDDDFDDAVVFQRGDKVLFHARHRWFKGVILKRIKASWFYDIRAANGTVFEAIQAKRIRLFDGDDEPKYSFEAGDRVLWRPSDAMSSRERHQTYKARVLAVRRNRTAARSSRDKEKTRYDLELLTGRVVKKVPHDELSPLRQYR